MWLTHNAGKTVPAKKTRAWEGEIEYQEEANKSALRQRRKARLRHGK